MSHFLTAFSSLPPLWHRNIWLPCCPKECWWIPGMIFMKWPVLPEWEQLLNMHGWKINEAGPQRERRCFARDLIYSSDLRRSCNCGKFQAVCQRRCISYERGAALPACQTSGAWPDIGLDDLAAQVRQILKEARQRRARNSSRCTSIPTLVLAFSSFKAV